MKPMTDRLDEFYFAVSPLMIFPRTLGRFRVYIRQAGHYVLYAAAGEQFTPEHRRRLHEAGVAEVFIRAEQRPDYEQYIEKHLPHILEDEVIPAKERAQVLYTASESVVREVFETRLPRGLAARDLTRVTRLGEKSLGFLAKDASLRCLAALTSHDYSVYTHNVQVFVYTAALLSAMRQTVAAPPIVAAGITIGITFLLRMLSITRNWRTTPVRETGLFGRRAPLA